VAVDVTLIEVTTSARAEGHWDVRGHAVETVTDSDAGSDHEVSNASVRAS
jgi:hypothetical protein